MYEDYFKFRGRPFLAAGRVDRFFPGSVTEQARQNLSRLIDRGEGAGLVVGAAGTGKSLLCQVLAHEFRDRFSVAVLSSGRVATRRALLQAILYELGLPYQGLDEGELRLALLDHLEPTVEGNNGLLLLIDEAHTLPSKLLEEIRLISNLVRDGQSRVRVIVAGNASLEERFASPKLSAFSQRLAARCYLEPLNSAETSEYVRSQIAVVGGDVKAVFETAALSTIYRATDGIPRLINQVCDHALILACLGGITRLTGATIEESWADLQQLPAPYENAREASAPSAIVEFGQLDEALEDRPKAIPIRSTKPPLHVAMADDPIEVISDHLSHLDDDVEPLAGSIGTEVELEFPEFGDPFSEEFAEEEVVLERYGAASELFAGLPRVSSPEGKKFGAILHPRQLETSAKPTLAKLPTEEANPAKPCARPPAAKQAERPQVAEPLVYPEPKLHSEPTVNNEPAPRPIAAIAPAQDDSDLIVIEDQPSVAKGVRPLPPGGQYRQLFAKLRRG